MPLRIFLTCTLVLATILPVAGLNNRPVKLSDLQALIERGDSVSVYDWQAKKILYTSSLLEDIAALKTAVTIETPEGGFRCACVPELEVRLSRKNKEVGTILVYPDGLTIGYEPWSSDARIQDKEKWLTWFDTRKIPGPRQEVEADEARDKNAQADEQRWMSAMPASLRPIWPKLVDQMMPGQALDTTSLNQALAKEFPERPKRIRALILWYGAGAGPWSGFPMYESVAEEMLLEYSTPELLAAIQSSPLTDQEKEGTARLFGGWDFNNRRPEDHALIPADLKKVLLDHSLVSADQDKIGRAQIAFGQK